MNHLMQEYWPIFEQYQALRSQLLDMVSDDDLQFKVEGNESLGALCLEIGETEQAYIQSFRDYKIEFNYQHPDTSASGSVDKLRAWYGQMDAELKAILAGMSEADLQKPVDRGGWMLPAAIHLDVYKEALLIFYGKTRVYLRALGKELPEQWAHWIA